jgi:hypothetical protein
LAALPDDPRGNDTRSTAARSRDIIPLTWQLDTEAVLVWPPGQQENLPNVTDFEVNRFERTVQALANP